jgi:hypothetical protein
MTTLIQHIIDKYQGSAPQKVISAVERAASRTGADFAQLMQNAATESGFNPSAKSSSSSATGLFQFIDSTWLSMVKEHGSKFGLGKYADQIHMKDGKPCVANCNVKNAILALRKDPEISALMAGVMSAQDKQYLHAHTDGTVGKTEMYLAHFMGAGTAAKFLNSRDDNGSASAAALFPKEAHANKSIFYTANGHARSLDQVYNVLAKKVGGTTDGANTTEIANGTADMPLAGSETTAPASSAHALPPSNCMPLMQDMMAQALPSSSNGGIIWNDAPKTAHKSGFSHSHGFIASQKISADSILALAQMQQLSTKPFFNT